jgi:hypothetical protein
MVVDVLAALLPEELSSQTSLLLVAYCGRYLDLHSVEFAELFGVSPRGLCVFTGKDYGDRGFGCRQQWGVGQWREP